MSELKSPLRKPLPEIAGIARPQLGPQTMVLKLFSLASRLPQRLNDLPEIAGTAARIWHEYTFRSRL